MSSAQIHTIPSKQVPRVPLNNPFFVFILFLTLLGATAASVPAAELLGPVEVFPSSQLSRGRLRHGAPATRGIGGIVCEPTRLSCGDTIEATLAPEGCGVFTGGQFDSYVFGGISGSTVTLDLRSQQFDTVLELSKDGEVAATDDDSGGGTNSRIVHTLDQTGDWGILVRGFSSAARGEYELSIRCSGTGGGRPAAPSELDATPFFSWLIVLDWNDNSHNEDAFHIEQRRLPGGSFEEIDVVAADEDGYGAVVTAGTSYEYRVRARNADGFSSYSNVVRATSPDETACMPDDTTLCLNGGRFRVTLYFAAPGEDASPARALDFGSDASGLFYFRNPNNAEMLVKVLNGCPLNDHYWVFYAATTNVEFLLAVTDTDAAVTRVYENRPGVAAPPVQDTEAFVTCP